MSKIIKYFRLNNAVRSVMGYMKRTMVRQTMSDKRKAMFGYDPFK